jgi:hypothetical protein
MGCSECKNERELGVVCGDGAWRCKECVEGDPRFKISFSEDDDEDE